MERRRLKFEVPDWETSSPGPLPEQARYAFSSMAENVALQSRRPDDVFEDFKWWFSGGTAKRSSTQRDAETDLDRLMIKAAENAPGFISTFFEACADIGQQGYTIPSVDKINAALGYPHYAGFLIDPDTNTIVQQQWVPSQAGEEPDPADANQFDQTDDEAPVDEDGQPETGRQVSAGILNGESTDTAPSAAKSGLKAFLCHSSGDKKAVRALHRRLRRDGFRPWLDEEDLLPGQDWETEIPKAVRSSDVVIVCLSKGSITKTGYVQKEIKFALDAADERPEGAIYLIPVLLEDCTVPGRLSKWHWVALYRYGGYKKLVASLRRREADRGR